ncbi:hypothetical protein GCM10010524_29520 [Streptomyces mexicanus]
MTRSSPRGLSVDADADGDGESGSDGDADSGSDAVRMGVVIRGDLSSENTGTGGVRVRRAGGCEPAGASRRAGGGTRRRPAHVVSTAHAPDQ